MIYEDFDLLLERAPKGFRAQVLNSSAGQASVEFQLPFSDVELENFLLKLGRTTRIVRRIESTEMTTAKSFGAALFDAVFAGGHDREARSSASTRRFAQGGSPGTAAASRNTSRAGHDAHQGRRPIAGARRVQGGAETTRRGASARPGFRHARATDGHCRGTTCRCRHQGTAQAARRPDDNRGAGCEGGDSPGPASTSSLTP